MDAKTIETLAVNAVRDSIVLSNYLDQFIPDNDKEPSWDGAVYIYDNKSKRKDTLIGRMPVQVKGKEAIKHPSEITHRVQITDLKNYLNDGGMIFFVVYISNNGLIRTVYYAPLTPIKLRILIKQACGHKSTQITLQRFPPEGDEKANIFLNCYNDCKKQASFSDAILYTEEELASRGVLEGMSISASSFNANIRDAFLKNEVYIYANIKGSTIPQPLEYIPTSLQIMTKIPASITVSGKPYYDHFTRVQSSKETVIRFGESFTLSMPTDSKKWGIHYSSADFLKPRLQDLDFMIATIENSGFEIDGIEMPIDVAKLNISRFDIDNQKSQLSDLQRAACLLDVLHCKEDLNLSIMTNTDIRNLFLLIQVFVEKQPIQQLQANLKPVSRFRIGNLQFALWFLRYGDDPKTYQIYDFFAHEHPVYSEQNSGSITSQYTLLDADNLLSLNNIQLSVLLPSFKKLPLDDRIANHANWMLLDLLSAYDKSGNKRTDLLNTATQFADWLFEVPDENLGLHIRLLNKLQTIKRTRPLCEDEENQLYELIQQTDADDILVGAYLLLDIQKLADRHFNLLDCSQQEAFKQLPIYHFWHSASN